MVRENARFQARAGQPRPFVVALVCGAGLAALGTETGAGPRAADRAPTPVRSLSGVGNLVGFLPGGNTLLTFSRDGAYAVRDWRTGKVLNEYVPGGQVDAGIMRGGHIYLLYRDGDLRVSDAATGRELRTVRVPAGYGHRLLWVSPDEKQAIVAVGGKPPMVYDLRSGRPAGELKDYRIDAVSPDGKLSVVPGSNRIVLTNTSTGKTVGAVQTSGATTRAVAFSADGKQLAVWYFYPLHKANAGDGYAGATILVDTRTGKAGRRISSRGDPAWLDPTHLSFSPDGKWLVGGGVPDTVVLWSLPRGRRVAVIRGRELGSHYTLTGISFSADGRYLAVGFWEGDVSIFEVRRAMPIPRKPSGAAVGAEQSRRTGTPDAHRLLTRMRRRGIIVTSANLVDGSKGPVSGLVLM